MMVLVGFSSQNLDLVTALQIYPRVKWTDLAPILGVSAASLARRWQQLHERGSAWVALSLVRETTSLSAPRAFIRMQCKRGALRDVANAIREDAGMTTIHLVTGRFDLLALVSMDLSGIEEYLVNRLGQIEGISSYHVLPCIQMLQHGGRWRADGLSASEAQAVAELNPRNSREKLAGTSKQVDLDSPLSKAIIELLYLDGRMSATEVWKRLHEGHGFESSLSTVHRRLSAIVDSQRLALRCDVSAEEVGFPVSVALWCRLPADHISILVGKLGARSGGVAFPEIRSIFVTSGETNLHFTLWLRSVEHLQEFEARLAKLGPELVIMDRSLSLSTPKRFGAVLKNGRRVRTVGPGPWSSP